MFNQPGTATKRYAMPIDDYGNWYPGITPEPATPGNSIIGSGGCGCLRSGAGVPDDGDGDNGDSYVNLTNGDVYTKSGDTWILQNSGGVGNLQADGSPVGVVTPDAVGQFYTDTAGNFLWQATGLTSADWSQRT